MNPADFWEWSSQVLKSFAEAGSWLIEPLPVVNVAPLFLFSMAGLVVFMGFAVAKWFIS